MIVTQTDCQHKLLQCWQCFLLPFEMNQADTKQQSQTNHVAQKQLRDMAGPSPLPLLFSKYSLCATDVENQVVTYLLTN